MPTSFHFLYELHPSNPCNVIQTLKSNTFESTISHNYRPSRSGGIERCWISIMSVNPIPAIAFKVLSETSFASELKLCLAIAEGDTLFAAAAAKYWSQN